MPPQRQDVLHPGSHVHPVGQCCGEGDKLGLLFLKQVPGVIAGPVQQCELQY